MLVCRYLFVRSCVRSCGQVLATPLVVMLNNAYNTHTGNYPNVLQYSQLSSIIEEPKQLVKPVRTTASI